MYAALSDRVLAIDDEVTERLVGHDVQCVAASRGDVYVGTADGVYRDTGDGFERVFAPDADLVTALRVTPAYVFAGTEPSRFYRSPDGDTWTECPGLTRLPSASEWSFPPRPDTHHVRWIQPTPEDDTLYVAIEAGALLRTPDGGDSWTDRTPDGPRDTHTMAVHPDAPERAYAAAGDGFFVTTDGGDTWTTRERGLAKTYCWSVAVAPGDPDAAAVSSAHSARQAHRPATADATVSYWDDGWRDWSTGLPDDLLVPSLLVASDTWYALTDHALYRAGDRGDPWTAVHEWDAPRARPEGLAADA